MKISDALKKAAAACVVRECDQEQPGRFVAYVDEGAESYDVWVQLDAGAQPEGGGCDCESRKPCRHIAALWLFVDKGEAVGKPAIVPAKAPSKRSKVKVSPAEALLPTVSQPELAAWLLQVFTANKDLELAFVNRFGAAGALKADDVVRMSEEAVRTVMGRKRIPDATMLTRLLQLWKDLHKPVGERYGAAPADRDAFEALAAAADAVMAFAAAHPGTARLQKYARSLLSGFAAQVSLLKQDEAFYQAAGFPVMHLLRQSPDSRIVTIDYLSAVVESVSGARLSWLAETLGTQFLLHRESRGLNRDAAYQLLLLKTFRKAGVFADYADAFNAISWLPELNIALIDAWTEAGRYRQAEDAAWREIDRNTKDAHNLPYYEALQRLYVVSENREGLAKLLLARVPHTFDFDDYLLAIDSLPAAADQRAFRNTMYTRARNLRTEAARTFTLRLAVHERNWQRLIEMIAREELDYAGVNQYIEPLLSFSQEELIRSLMQRRDWNAIYEKDQEGLNAAVEALVSNIMGACHPAELRLLVQRAVISFQHSTPSNLFRPRIVAVLNAAAGK